MEKNKLLLYGANGYTGRLITELAKSYGVVPILAGRNQEKLKQLGRNHQLEYRAFGLENGEEIRQNLHDVRVVLHAAGPFSKTAKSMMKACLATHTHYLDITGEIEVFELGYSLNQEAEKAGILLMPGVGFDVVPTDCMALYLKNQLPDASHLQLAFAMGGGGLSKGTSTTAILNLGRGGAVRANRRIQRVPVGHKTMWVQFGEKKRFVMSIPWGDISTAYRTTGIPNIETFTGIPPGQLKWVKLQNTFGWLFRKKWVQNILLRRLSKMPDGPSESQRQKAESLVYGKAWNQSGKSVSSFLSGPEGYTLTAHTSLIISKIILDKNPPSGFGTPAGVFGENLIREVPGIKWDQ